MMMKTLVSLGLTLGAFVAHAQLPEASSAAQPGSFLQVAADAGHRVIVLATDQQAAARSRFKTGPVPARRRVRTRLAEAGTRPPAGC